MFRSCFSDFFLLFQTVFRIDLKSFRGPSTFVDVGTFVDTLVGRFVGSVLEGLKQGAHSRALSWASSWALVGTFVGPLVGTLMDPLVGSNFTVPVTVLYAFLKFTERSNL